MSANLRVIDSDRFGVEVRSVKVLKRSFRNRQTNIEEFNYKARGMSDIGQIESSIDAETYQRLKVFDGTDVAVFVVAPEYDARNSTYCSTFRFQIVDIEAA